MVKLDNKQKSYILEKEAFKEIELDGELKFRYAISNFGRLISFTENFDDGRIVKGSITDGYRIFRYKLRTGYKIYHRHKFFHRLVAEQFLPKTFDEQTYVLHLDHNLANDIVDNLQWATRDEMLQHQNRNPRVRKSRKQSGKRIAKWNRKNKRDGKKLTSAQVALIKEILSNPERDVNQKIIAHQFGISQMQVYRIKSGKNWGHVNIDSQDVSPTTGKPSAKKVTKNEKPFIAKKVDLTQMSKRELEKLKIERAWNEKLEAFRKGEKSELIQRWIDYNRRQYRKGRLPTEKFEKLTGVNFLFEVAPKIKKATNSWDRQLEEWKKGNRKSVPIQQWKQRSIRRFVEGKLSRDRIEKLKKVGILK